MQVLFLVPAGAQPHPTLLAIIHGASSNVRQVHYTTANSGGGDSNTPSVSSPLPADIDVLLVQCDRSVSMAADADAPSTAVDERVAAAPTAAVAAGDADASGSSLASSPASTSAPSVRGSGTEDPRFRWSCFEQRVSMVTALVAARRDLTLVLGKVAAIVAARQMGTEAVASQHGSHLTYQCPFCPQAGLPEDALHAHVPLYHANAVQREPMRCPICARSTPRLGVHLYNDHGPPGRGAAPSESRSHPNVLYPYSLVICRRPRDGRFLVVQEFANSGFWLPGGRAENGENLQEAAIRETREEAGVDVQLKGVLRMEYTSEEAAEGHRGTTRLRVFFYAEPINDEEAEAPTPARRGASAGGSDDDDSSDGAAYVSGGGAACKTIPDYESVGAAWVTLQEVMQIQLRGSEPRKWFNYVASGGSIYPMSLLKSEY